MAAPTKAELQARVAKLERALAREKKRKGDPEALARSRDAQAATAKILRVIRKSPSDVQPVFEGIADAAMRLLKAFSVLVVRYDGSQMQLVAARGARPGSVARVRALFPRSPGNAGIAGRCILARKVVSHADAWRDRNADVRKIARARGYRSALAVPLLDGRKPIGAIAVSRTEAGAFARVDVDLLRSFADQAVIAIENARAFHETREALVEQKASGEVLTAIAGSMSDATPVFDRILETCERLFTGYIAGINVIGDDGLVHLAAWRGPKPEAYARLFPMQNSPDSGTGIAIATRKTLHYPDLEAPGVPRGPRESGRATGVRSVIIAPLLAEEGGIGSIYVSRKFAGPFTEREIARLEGFANQATIAIKNARQFRETREALERQTATADILKVISGSPDDVQPVFDAVAHSSMRLLGALSASVSIRVGDTLQLGAFTSTSKTGDQAVKDLFPLSLTDNRETILAQSVLKAAPAQVGDAQGPRRRPRLRQIARRRGFHSIIAVPMLSKGVAIGTVSVTRREAGGFSDHEVELLTTFADQAVIAIENVRLFNETREALERQTATARILEVISSTPTDDQPVFDSIVRSAVQLCGSLYANLYRYDGELIHLVASHNVAPEQLEVLRRKYPMRPDESQASSRVVLRKAIVRIERALEDPDYDHRFAELSGWQRLLGVPMMREETVLGALVVGWADPGHISPAHELLLKTFADQAVIAIENVRLFNETKEALERQTATSEILKVIASSPTDVQPVLEAVAERAAHLCEATDAHVWRREGDALQAVAGYGGRPIRRPRATISRQSVMGRTVVDGEPVHVLDLPAVFESEFPDSRAMLEGGNRTVLGIPLLREGTAIGGILIRRTVVNPFSDKQIALLQTFADQAVIAIENVRLFNETKEALEHQTATSDVLRVISTSPTDVQPVLDAIAESAARLCESSDAQVLLCTDSALRIAAQYGSEIRDTVGTSLPLNRDSATARAVIDSAIVHVADVSALPAGELEQTKTNAAASGWQSILSVPLLRDGAAVGAIAARRSKASAFSPRQIALLKTFADQAVIAIENVRLFNQTREALERQTATAEILKVISGSPTDVQPVFDAVASHSMRLLGARSGTVTLRAGDALNLAAFTSTTTLGDDALKKFFPVSLVDQRDTILAQAALSGAPVHVPDTEDPHPSPTLREIARRRGYRSILAVPMLSKGTAIGTVSVSRGEAGRFSDHDIELLTTFADQAVIAIENVRLFNETREALERQTATAEILRVISSSPTDVQPVFDMIGKLAGKLCAADISAVTRFDGEKIQLVALEGVAEDGVALVRRAFPMYPGEETVIARALDKCDVEHVADVMANPSYARKSAARASGFRGCLGVPMIREGNVIGVIFVARVVPGHFADSQVALLKTFAGQAVIAIENVRLFNETQEALERQTATADILKVISASPTDIKPVLNAVAENAARLCEASDAIIQLREGDQLRWAAHYGALPNLPLDDTRTISRDLVTGRAVLEKRQIHVHDLQAETDDYPIGSRLAAEFGYHTILATPLMREGNAVGVIMVRHNDLRPFDEKHLALVSTFADQAVIAIENVRLFNETKEALERQTASAEILRVIASSPAQVEPVFEAIVASAMRLFNAKSAVLLRRGESHFSVGAYAGPDVADLPEQVREAPLDPDKNFPSRAILRGEIVHVPDWAGDDIPEHEKIVGKAFGIRSGLIVPLLKNEVGIGALAVTREAAGAYGEKEIALLRSFADQAVIAIENVRLFNETKEALERQTATAEVLRTISASPTDTQPVFDIIAERAATLCGASDSAVMRYDGTLVHLAAQYNMMPEAGEGLQRAFPCTLEQNGAGVRTIRTGQVVQIHDVRDIPDYQLADVAEVGGRRRLLGVPLMRGGRAIGAVVVAHNEPGQFSDHQIGLVKTFADQAVIAIENVRLFNETKEALERQTATAEILKVISGSPTDVQPVFDAIADSAMRLCGGDQGLVFTFDGTLIHIGSLKAMTPEEAELLRSAFPAPPSRGSASARAILTRKIVQIPDVLEDPEYELKDISKFGGWRSNVSVPMLRDGIPIGTITVNHHDPRPFSDAQVALLQTFADQAVIAIENVRLFNETKEALERQTATGEILSVISGSPTDVQPVFDTIVKNAVELSNALFSAVYRFDGERLHLVAHHNYTPEVLELENRVYPMRPDRGQAVGRAILDRELVHIPDALIDPDYQHDIATTGGWRSMVAVPMFRDESPVGVIWVARAQAGPFSSHQIELLETFADQAVIAIENVRLFNETKEALERQTATAEILKVISSSPTNVQPVFYAICRSAARLLGCRAGINMLEGDEIHLRAIATPGSAAETIDVEGVAIPTSLADGTRRDAERLLEMSSQIYPVPYRPEHNFIARSIATGTITSIADTEAPEVHSRMREFGRVVGYRAITQIPMVRDGAGIGTIGLVFDEPGRLLDDRQRTLIQTFADQAVIAIENVRLFNETKEALERQTATAEILKVISESPTDVQPVFDAIVRSAVQLCDAVYGVALKVEGGLVHLVTQERWPEESWARAQQIFPMPLDSDHLSAIAIRENRVIHADHLQDDPDLPATSRELARLGGYQTLLIVPMTRGAESIGAIVVARKRAFSDDQIALLRTFADQAVIAVENVRLFNETREALERQTATAEILKVIAGSPSDVQPVFDAIAKSALQLIGGRSAIVARRVDDSLHLAALTATTESGDEALRKSFPTPVSGRAPLGKAVLSGMPAYTSDIETDPAFSPEFRKTMRARGTRSLLAVPMLREGNSIGGIGVTRDVAGPFTDHQINLLQTFADQAVIAIENVRLFNETKEALEQQRVSGEVLSVISNSIEDAQPVFEKIVESCERLFAGSKVGLNLVGPDGLVHAGAYGKFPGVDKLRAEAFPHPANEESATGAAVLAREVIHYPDALGDPNVPFYARRGAQTVGFRSFIMAPLLSEGRGLGAIFVGRETVGSFTEKEIALLKTFANQAVIAIQNARLFNETREALERQTATADILKVISASPTEVQPVFDAIVHSALHIFAGTSVGIGLIDGDRLRFVASGGKLGSVPSDLYVPRSRDSVTGLAVLDRTTVNIGDTEAPDAPSFAREHGRRLGFRSMAATPLMREGEAIGALAVYMAEPGGLGEKQRALLNTFADQAVIAIENTRLFRELQARTEALTKSVGQLTALGEVSQALSSTLDVEKVLQTIASRAVQLTGLDGAAIYEYDEDRGVFTLRGGENIMPELVELYRNEPIRFGEGAVGRAAELRAPVQVADILEQGYQSRARDVLQRAGARALLAVPLLREGHILGAIAVIRNRPGEFAAEVTELLQTFATQSAIAIQNARLFREIEEKGRQLAEASQHKSQFLASMSHELRTPLNAILGFNEMILGEVYGEVPADMKEPLEDIQTSGKHLLRLINNVLDLAKIEAGRMELALADYSVQDMVESVRSTLRPLAEAKGLEFLVSVPNDLPLAHGDSGRLTQCLMNLAGNSLKFTKEGHVAISVEPNGDMLAFHVADTGIGIPPEKIDTLFTEFKQTDATIASEYGGTGLGLSITKKFIEMHGGRIWIESELGKGSSFIFEIPLRTETGAAA